MANSQEIEALCEGWHPLFKEEDIVVLDGSDSWKPTPTNGMMVVMAAVLVCTRNNLKGR